jgi:enoyl-CoA hydratase/carnithine racemase
MSIIENKVIGNTLLLTINNASKRNSMIKGFHDEFQKSIIAAEENANIFSIVVNGAGDFFLCWRRFKFAPNQTNYDRRAEV